ncbi:MAG TPA: hypothetical protein VFZ53_04375 [Polyangiaceae bacterium]
MAAQAFHPEPIASDLARSLVTEFLGRSPAAQKLAAELLVTVGARLRDALDVVSVGASDDLRDKLRLTGFVRTGQADGGAELWEHTCALFPLFELRDDAKPRGYLRVDSVVDFLESARLVPLVLEGEAGTLVRRALVADEESELWVVERSTDRKRATSASAVREGPGAALVERHLQAFRLRPRPIEDAALGFDAALELVRAAQRDLGETVTCELFFEAERRFYTRRNRAARMQKARQDSLGLGWFNRDHHTYRSSRIAFRSLVALLEALGLHCRERFYAGHEAGWGAQVMEHSGLGICVFADVDLSPEEVTGDFAHRGLDARDSVGTVGLWCELHGEAFLAAGMHHLECQFDFDAVRQRFAADGITVMPPFTDYPHLKQAFTEGELWRVAPARLERARERGFLSAEQAERITREGTLGSHFEVLERNDGYKGFNQAGINKIIEATDPRRQAQRAPLSTD